ncbi:MAG: nitroreductase family protein [Dehalococcoidia bacterium]|nr:nitroreductase family protein [Dehalococcoidia bacterium]
MDVFEAINTTRAMRRLKADPVPDDLVWKVLDAAIRAPSGGNRQPWNFIVVRERATKEKIAGWYLDSWNKSYALIKGAAAANPETARTYASAEYLANHLADVPVLIIATVNQSGVAAVSPGGASIYPAVQNLMLAARALGLGTALTTLHRTHEAEVKALLGIPEGVETMALIPLGWPRGKFGAGPRLPVEKVTYWETWGQTGER